MLFRPSEKHIEHSCAFLWITRKHFILIWCWWGRMIGHWNVPVMNELQAIWVNVSTFLSFLIDQCELTRAQMLMRHFLVCGMTQNIGVSTPSIITASQLEDTGSCLPAAVERKFCYWPQRWAGGCLRVGGNRLPLSRFSQRKVAAVKANYTLDPQRTTIKPTDPLHFIISELCWQVNGHKLLLAVLFCVLSYCVVCGHVYSTCCLQILLQAKELWI